MDVRVVWSSTCKVRFSKQQLRDNLAAAIGKSAYLCHQLAKPLNWQNRLLVRMSYYILHILFILHITYTFYTVRAALYEEKDVRVSQLYTGTVSLTSFLSPVRHVLHVLFILHITYAFQYCVYYVSASKHCNPSAHTL